jgi:hypothetical protein
MRRLSIPAVVLFILCFLFLAPAAAQNSSYRLRDLSATDYLHGVMDAIGEGNFFCSFDLNSACRSFRLLAMEATLRYDLADADYVTLKEAYDKIIRLARSKNITAQHWTEQVILAWLRETGIDLHLTRHFRFEGFDIQVKPFDADGDGQDEWLLTVNTGQRGFEGLLTLRRNPNSEFEFLSTPLPVIRPCCFAEYDIRSWESINLIRTDDVNVDGKDEVVAFTSASSRYETNSRGRLFVLGLREGKMVDLMSEPLNFSEPVLLRQAPVEAAYQTHTHSWQFSLDSGQPELSQIARRLDNLDCVRYETLRFRWQDDRYRLNLTERQIEFEDSIGCTLRKAQEAFWAGDFESAIPLYDKMLAMELPSDMPDWSISYYAAQRTYAQIRLAQAQALSGDIQGAEVIMKNARLETDDTHYGILIDSLLKTDQIAFGLCQRAYQYFAGNEGYWEKYVNALYDPPDSFYTLPLPSPDPSKAGCDISMFVEHTLDGWAKDSDTNPRDYLESAGIQVEESLSADLNNDGADDHLIWINPAIDAFIFLSTPDPTYRVEQVPIPQPDKQVSVSVRLLPDKSSYAIIATDSGDWYASHTELYGFNCTDRVGEENPPLFEMWQVDEDRIELSLQAPICEYPFMPENLFTLDGSLRVGAQEMVGRGYVTRLYPWDTNTHSFRAPDVIIPPYTESPAVIEQSIITQFQYSGATFLDSMSVESPDVVLREIDDWLHDFPDDDATLYERAVVLDLMGDQEGALAGFIDVYERFPDTVYGRLARLHLE